MNYEIRFYRMEKDIIVYDKYRSFDDFKKAYEEFLDLITLYAELKNTDLVFNPSIPDKLLERYVRFLHKRNKELVIIHTIK